MKALGKIITWLCVIIFLVTAVLFGKGYYNYTRLIKEESIEQRVESIRMDSEFVDYEYLPETFVQATVAIEDHRFFEHGGVDYIGLFRAMVSWFDEDMINSGGSTITQQLAKNMYNMFDSSLDRKIVELFIAKDLEKNYTKEEIFALYVNVINYGDQHFGIYQAASGYFGKNVYDLTDNESTLLAGIPQSPANYQLSDHYDAAKRKQKLVLQRMVEEGYMDSIQAQQIEQMN